MRERERERETIYKTESGFSNSAFIATQEASVLHSSPLSGT
jgi:hypothetical protein